MPDIRWGAFDLNLLVVFDAVMRDHSVTRAATRLGLSQPATSHALARLRHTMRDELFIRSPEGMTPTARAEQLAGPVRNALNELQFALEPEAFAPATARHRFVLMLNNYAAVVLAPPLAAAVAAAAPFVELDLRPSGTLDIAAELDRGEVDLALGRTDIPGERFASVPIVQDTFVLVTRAGHRATRQPLSATAFAGLSHLEISSAREDTGFIDHFLADHGLERRIMLRAPYISAAKLLAQSEMVATLSRRIAQALIEDHPLQARETPCPSPTIVTRMTWHRRRDNQPAHRWLRDLVTSVSKSLERTSRARGEPRQSPAAQLRRTNRS
ncbi:MAG TPA: LysR family transcriptional regulator [Xanthobacteraceae bacterium]|nr:LysR family transcriptional regulator [Xanthobacteraceae bacterium]